MNIKNNPKSKSKLRYLAVNLLTIIFIIMTYFYISEIFGSISTPYIYANKFEIIFAPSLYIFVLFSILSGPIQAFISGLLGEFIYQLAFYDSLEISWCFLIGFFGLISALYKYKPLKYQKVKPILYSSLILIVTSIIFVVFMIFYQILLYSNIINLNQIFINFGLKLFIECLVSITFLIPLSLFIYDRILASEERVVFNLFLTHHPVEASDHTFAFKFGRTYVYFCSRCSGMMIGLIFSIFFIHVVEKIIHSVFDPSFALLLIIILPIPGLIDWGTQRLLLRSSSTSSRIFTGFIIGVAMNLVPFTEDYKFIAFIIISIYFGILLVLFYIGQKLLLRKLDKELTPQPPEIQYEEEDK